MPLVSDISYAIENLGNESLYPMIELMCELDWDPIDKTEHAKLLEDIEAIFKYLYNNQNNNGANNGKENPHAQVHHQLYEALRFALNEPKGVDLFEDLFKRSSDKRNVMGFTERMKTLLSQHPEGLKKALELYTEMYHIAMEHQHTLVTTTQSSSKIEIDENDETIDENLEPDKEILISNDQEELAEGEEALERCKLYAVDDEFCNAQQFRQFIADKKCREMLQKEILNSPSQRTVLAERILNHTKYHFIEQTIKNINRHMVHEQATVATATQYHELIRAVHSLTIHFENPDQVAKLLNQIAKNPLVQKNVGLRSYLGERFAIKSSMYQDPSEILTSYDDFHDLIYFKPELVKQVQEKLNLDLMESIKSEFSKRIYRHDGLIETYVPASMKGLKSTKENIYQLLYAYNDKGELNLPEGPLNALYHKPNGGHCLFLIMNCILNDHASDSHKAVKEFKYNDFFKRDEQYKNLVDFQEPFFSEFLKNEENIHQLQMYMELVKVRGTDDKLLLELFDVSKYPSMEARIEKLCQHYYNSGQGDKLYAQLSSLAGQSVNLDLLLERSPDKKHMLGIKKELWEIFPNREAQAKLFMQLMLIDQPKSYYDIEQAVYQYPKLKTRHAMQFQSLRNEFTLFKEKHLFRNGVETRQHVPSTDEYADLQVGDTQGSNVSLTQVGDIATVYAMGFEEEPDYAWITIHQSQKAVNCSHYMEGHDTRLAAQEFSTGALQSKDFLGAIRIRKIKPDEKGYNPSSKQAVYKIIDGFVNENLLKQFSSTPSSEIHQAVKLHGLEGPAAQYLSRAILYARAEREDSEAKKLLTQMDAHHYLNFAANVHATTERVRTGYQEQFDSPLVRRKSLSPKDGDHANLEKMYKGKKVRLLDPSSLRHYHHRQKSDILMRSHESANLRSEEKARLKSEKDLRRNEIDPSREIAQFTNFSSLPLDTETKLYAEAYYSEKGLERLKTLAKPFSQSTSFPAYVSFIENILLMDDLLYGEEHKQVEDKIHYAIKKMYEIDPDKAEKALINIITAQYNLKRFPMFQNRIASIVIDAIKRQDKEFVSDKNFPRNMQLAINLRIQDETGLTAFFHKAVKDDFLEKLEWSLEFIDTTNILTVMLSPNLQVHEAPWRLYQRQSEWSTNRQLENWKRTATKTYEISPTGLDALFEDLSEGENLPHTSRGAGLLSKMRNYPILAGGGLDKHGNPIPGHLLTDRSVCTQYFRINDEQLTQMRHNEFLQVIDAHPCPQTGKYGANHVVRYRYMDLRDCERLAKKYHIDPNLVKDVNSTLDTEVPPSIVKALWPKAKSPLKISELNQQQFIELTAGLREFGELIDTYNTNLKNPKAYPGPGEREEVVLLKKEYKRKYLALKEEIEDNKEFATTLEQINELTQKTLYSVVASILADPNISPIERYQKLVSVHFFPDMNGRSMRMLYRHDARKPLYMANWDLDITMPSGQEKLSTDTTSIFEFVDHEFDKYVNMIGALRKEHERARLSQTKPNYYACAEFWMACFEINPKYYTPEELEDFMKKFQVFYKTDPVQRAVEKKSYYDYMQLIMAHIYSWDKIKIESHIDIKHNSPLHLACQNKYEMGCLLNLLTQADRQKINLVDLRNKYNQTPAHVAACYLNLQGLAILLEHSSLLFAQEDMYHKTPYNNLLDVMHHRISEHSLPLSFFEEFIPFAQSLDNKKYNICEYRFEDKKTLAHILADNEDIDALELLLKEMPEFSEKVDAKGLTPVGIAMKKGLYVEDNPQHIEVFLDNVDEPVIVSVTPGVIGVKIELPLTVDEKELKHALKASYGIKIPDDVPLNGKTLSAIDLVKISKRNSSFLMSEKSEKEEIGSLLSQYQKTSSASTITPDHPAQKSRTTVHVPKKRIGSTKHNI